MTTGDEMRHCRFCPQLSEFGASNNCWHGARSTCSDLHGLADNQMYVVPLDYGSAGVEAICMTGHRVHIVLTLCSHRVHITITSCSHGAHI